MMLRNTPSLDIHGETRDTIVYLVNDFIKDNVTLNKEFIVIVHGKGTGILKQKVHEILKHHKDVLEFHLAGFNTGATEVKLKQKSRKLTI